MRSDDVRFAQNGTTNGATRNRPYRPLVAHFRLETDTGPELCRSSNTHVIALAEDLTQLLLIAQHHIRLR
jgi:hypothetical protein